LDKYGPLIGLIDIKTLPYLGGFNSSPPKTETDSTSE
jgi:hypothetical protein